MISRITGRLVEVSKGAAEVAVGGVCYEVLVPSFVGPALSERGGDELTFFTYQYLEGTLAGGNYTPRLIGFLSPADRAFFREFTKVKNVGIRKALRAMSVPPGQIARAIEEGDERVLTTLPEIGKRTAGQIIAQLRGQLAGFTSDAEPRAAVPALSSEQQVAVEILVQWGDRRGDAEQWVAEAVAADPSLAGPDEIVRAAYRFRHRPVT